MSNARPRGARRAAPLLLALALAGCGVKWATVRTDKGEDLMLLGHDPVAYFTVGKPVRGFPGISATHNEVTYYFASEENRARFLASPARYEPQYGAFCADGAAYGVKLGSDPTEFAIRDGRLFIFGDVVGREFWLLRPAWDVEKADLMWPEAGSRGHITQSLYRLTFRVRVVQDRQGAECRMGGEESRQEAHLRPGRGVPQPVPEVSRLAGARGVRPACARHPGHGPVPAGVPRAGVAGLLVPPRAPGRSPRERRRGRVYTQTWRTYSYGACAFTMSTRWSLILRPSFVRRRWWR